tara:strand:- start:313 stop:2157 length:1845 start_codon:yes stop_codon:yes gene_type:complete
MHGLAGYATTVLAVMVVPTTTAEPAVKRKHDEGDKEARKAARKARKAETAAGEAKSSPRTSPRLAAAAAAAVDIAPMALDDASSKAAKRAAKKAAKAAKQASNAGETANAKKDMSAPAAADVTEADAKAARKAAKKAAKAAAAVGAHAVVQQVETTPAALPPTEGCREDDAAYRDRFGIKPGDESKVLLPPCYRSFASAPFASAVVAALHERYAEPTPIQAQSWPVLMAGGDLVAVAKTGSGKTLGFVLPVLQSLSAASAAASAVAGDPPSVRALVLAPTRELAIQIQEQSELFCALVGLRSACVYGGGVPAREQATQLRKTQPALLVATPGRLVDLLGQKALSLRGCAHLILDEADRMLDMGFAPQLKQIVAALPSSAQRQTAMFTATWPKSVRQLAQTMLRGAGDGSAAAAAVTTQVFIGTNADAELEANTSVKQVFVHATDDVKEAKLYKLLCELAEGSRVICFANTKRRVDHLEKAFWKDGFGSCSVHGDKQQAEREAALRKFTSDECPLMFATDVAARGIDIKGVSHVVNFDMAKDVESYVHRIGRTGRAGATGTSITFWNPDYDKECAPALAKIAREAGQEVPEWLSKFEKAKANKAWAVEKATLTAA